MLNIRECKIDPYASTNINACVEKVRKDADLIPYLISIRADCNYDDKDLIIIMNKLGRAGIRDQMERTHYPEYRDYCEKQLTKVWW